MSNSDRKNLEPQQRLARDAMRSLSRPAADPDFRARLKSQFVAGEIPRSELSEPLPRRSILSGGSWWGVSGLAAAAMIAALLLGFNRLPGPDFLASNGVGTVTIDGRELPAGSTAEIDAALRAGGHVQVGEGGSLDIVYPGSFAMRLGAGTDMVLPPRPGRWTRRTVEGSVTYGEVSVRTGPDLAGGALVISTDEGRAVIHGTLVSVLRNEAVTCVCLIEGSADILTDAADLGAVPLGMRWVLFRDGSEPQLLEIVPEHRDHMLGLDATLKGVF